MTGRPGIGIQDSPVLHADGDVLGLAPYATALAQFIASCKTPMSIGIQGDWGLGKTSLMKLVEQRLCSPEAETRCYTYWINTWQLSQFDLGDRLPATTIQSLADQLVEPSARNSDKLWGSLASGIRAVAAHVLQEKTGLQLQKGEAAPQDPATLLEGLKRDFAALCAARCGSDEAARVVFFIDDLDRLLPRRAVELMEVMKNFLDVERTVFVLACDYQVVVKGLREKFGVGEDELGGRSFFDKIIQVPFRMPQQSYRIKEYVREILGAIGFEIHGGIEDYEALVRYSMGFNPRSIKRHCNTMLLLRLVMENSLVREQQEIAKSPHKLKLLFGSLCMEAVYPQLYSYLAQPSEEVTLRRLEQLGHDGDLASEFKGTVTPALRQFAACFYDIVDEDRDGNLSDAEVRTLQSVLNVSAMASIEETAPVTEGWNRDVDAFLRGCQPAVRNALGELLALPDPTRYGPSKKRGEPYLYILNSLNLEVVDEQPDTIRLFFDWGSDSDLYLPEFRKLGYDPERHSPQKFEGSWRAAQLSLVFNPVIDRELFRLSKQMVRWWFSVEAENLSR